jgi:hypothetical protein
MAAAALVQAGVLSIAQDARRDGLFHATAALDIFDRFRAIPARRASDWVWKRDHG